MLCGKTDEEINISQLLDGIERKESRQQKYQEEDEFRENREVIHRVVYDPPPSSVSPSPQREEQLPVSNTFWEKHKNNLGIIATIVAALVAIIALFLGGG